MATNRLFDPISLMNENIAANATRRDPLPAAEVPAQIIEIGFSDGVSGPHTKKPGAPWTRMDVKLEITDPDFLAQIPGNPDKAVTTLGIMLDMDGAAIKTGPNVNVRLGRLREATNTNGKPFAMMVGCWIRIVIGHKPNPKDPESVLDEVVAYTKL